MRRGRAVGGFRDDFGFDVLGVVQGDDVFKRGGDQDVALEGQQFVIRNARGAGHPHYCASALFIAGRSQRIDSARVVHAAARIADRNDFGFLLREQARNRCANISKSLDRDGRAAQGHFLHLACFLDHVHATASGGVAASLRTANRHGLPRDHSGRRVTDRHRVGVHNPRHRLSVGVNVRCWNIDLGADDGLNFRGVAARHALEFAF